MMNNATYIALCVAQMAMDGNSAATIEFFRKIAPTLMSSGMINGVQAAELTGKLSSPPSSQECASHRQHPLLQDMHHTHEAL